MSAQCFVIHQQGIIAKIWHVLTSKQALLIEVQSIEIMVWIKAIAWIS